jgi:3-phenylpropionate/trans-cinnamate dioxygenase ferredoxin subunit
LTLAPSPGAATVTVAVARDQAGAWFAIGGICTHGPVELGEGDVIGCALECWGHGSRFDLRTGQPLNLPATDPLPAYRLKLDADRVLIDLSDPSEGEPTV